MLALKKDKLREIYNIGGGNRITLNDILPILEKLLKKKLLIKYIEKQKGKDTFTDTSKARHRPKAGLEEGLKEEILWPQERRW